MGKRTDTWMLKTPCAILVITFAYCTANAGDDGPSVGSPEWHRGVATAVIEKLLKLPCRLSTREGSAYEKFQADIVVRRHDKILSHILLEHDGARSIALSLSPAGRICCVLGDDFLLYPLVKDKPRTILLNDCAFDLSFPREQDGRREFSIGLRISDSLAKGQIDLNFTPLFEVILQHSKTFKVNAKTNTITAISKKGTRVEFAAMPGNLPPRFPLLYIEIASKNGLTIRFENFAFGESSLRGMLNLEGHRIGKDKRRLLGIEEITLDANVPGKRTQPLVESFRLLIQDFDENAYHRKVGDALWDFVGKSNAQKSLVVFQRYGARIRFHQSNGAPRISIELDKKWRGGSEPLDQLHHVNGLRIFNCKHRPTSSAAVAAVAKLDDLEGLALLGAHFDRFNLSMIARLGKLQILNLDGAGVTDENVLQLLSLETLKVLNLSNTLITDIGISKLEQLTHLKSLSLKGTKLSDLGMQNIARISSLEVLDIRETQVGETSVKDILEMPMLRTLYLGKSSRISESSKERLKRKISMLEIH